MTRGAMRVFRDSFHAAAWQERNCELCAKHRYILHEDELGEYSAPLCEIDLAIVQAAFDGGQFRPEIAKRMGYKPPGPDMWQCREIEALPEYADMVNEIKMRELGPDIAPTLLETE